MELNNEAQWIYETGFRDGNVDQTVAIQFITAVLEDLLVQHLEIPYISYYRKDHWDITDFFSLDVAKTSYLWLIHELDEKYYKLSQERDKLKDLYSAVPEVLFT